MNVCVNLCIHSHNIVELTIARKKEDQITKDSFSTNTNRLGVAGLKIDKTFLNNHKFECTITTEEKSVLLSRT